MSSLVLYKNRLVHYSMKDKLFWHKMHAAIFDFILLLLRSIFGKRAFSCSFLVSVFMVSCSKMVQIDPPTNSISTSQVFADSANAASAIRGIYSNLEYSGGGNIGFGSGSMSIYCGMSADELLPFNTFGDQFSNNSLTATNGLLYGYFWGQAFLYLYQTNAAIEGLQAAKNISVSTKTQFIGEAKFLRSLINFNLVNLFGDIPLVTSSNFEANSLAFRKPASEVYDFIVQDLLDAKNSLQVDYSAGLGERVRANSWAATALLARVYLFRKDWVNAEKQATEVINNQTLYKLVDDPNKVFLANSSEAILQWHNNSTTNTFNYNSTQEAHLIIPTSPTLFPTYYLSPQFLASFEPGDLRRSTWIDSSIYSGIVYYYPYKYKIGRLEAVPDGQVTEYYTVLRLAEQYLIRAEARANQNTNLSGAISDLNLVRERAHLTDLPNDLSQIQVLKAIAQERKIELFVEWGHRWLDLKRTDQIDSSFAGVPYKTGWQGYQKLYPIPYGELQRDPNLTQNPGY